MGLSGTIVWMTGAGVAALYLVGFYFYTLFKSHGLQNIPASAMAIPEKKPSASMGEVTESLHFSDAMGSCPEHSAVIAGQKSLIGGRKQQEDSLRVEVTRSGGLMSAVCDGMGGLARGDAASEYAVKRLFAYAQDISDAENTTQLLRQAAIETDLDIAEMNRASALRSGTTAVAVLCFDSVAYWLSVGDSRIYFYRDRQLIQVTRDHNYELAIKLAIEAGESVSPEAMQAERPDALISYLGMGGGLIADAGRIDLKGEDMLLLCSDGLFKALTDEEISQILDSFGANASGCADALCTSAISRGGARQDNTSVIVIRAK